MKSDQLTPAHKAGGGFRARILHWAFVGVRQGVLDGGAHGWDCGFGKSWLVDPTCALAVITLTQRDQSKEMPLCLIPFGDPHKLAAFPVHQ
jgi:hypothetical protein